MSTEPVARASSLRARLVRAGFADPARAERLLADPDLVAVLGDRNPATLVEGLAPAASPDDALLAITRIAGAVRGGPGAADLRARLTGTGLSRLVAVLGASPALGEHLARHPGDLTALDEPGAVGRGSAGVREELLAAVGATPGPAPVAGLAGEAGVSALRRAYRRRLLRIAADDVTTPDPLTLLPGVAAALADLAGAALEAALAVARAETADHHLARLAVIGMGKTGGRELNYVSDVDVIHVAEPAPGADEAAAMAVATKLATGLARVCSGPGDEPPLWPVDAALRPEGKAGPLVRTVASHVAYYERWAKTWEFQSLLKARLVAGDPEVGAEYLAAITPMVWTAVERENFVDDAQAMRRRVEQHIPAAEADRQIKLGAGGLRDVEFTVQLLQLVHGRGDPSIRSGSTLTAISALSAAGYVGRDHAAALAVRYREARLLEHRIQLVHLRRTHLLPTEPTELRRLARAIGRPGESVEDHWRAIRREVRHLHEELFYRPLLPATASLSREDVALAPEAARARLAAIGYRDPAGALRHIAALTEGVSRRAAIQRQLLPVLLGWFAEGPDPDGGLLAFRNVSETLGTTHWYLKLLRDSGTAAHNLAVVLSTSRFAAAALARSPESVTWLGDAAELTPRDVGRLTAEVDAVLRRQDDPGTAATLLRALRRREVARTAVAEVLGREDVAAASAALADAADVVLAGALRIAEHEAAAAPEGLVTRTAIIAMGRLGGRESGYGSDADVLFVHRPEPGAPEPVASAQATAVAARVRALLGAVGPEPTLEVDAGLRPEGRNGPLTRTVDSYAEYYARWASPWEAQALLRARPVAGPEDLRDRFVELIDPVRYPAGGADPALVKEVRRLKARMEAERLPRGVDPHRHLKLGRGGLSDVEWTVQLLQLSHGHEVPGLRTTSTLSALAAAQAADLMDADDAEVLREAWTLASRLRDAIVLWGGEGSANDVLPADTRTLGALARLLGMGPGAGARLEDTYLKVGRRARAVAERLLYG